MSNRETLRRLLAEGRIQVRSSSLFDVAPQALPESFDFDRVEGMMLGLAVGDALGVTTEGMLPANRAQSFGEIRDYRPNRHVRVQQPGEPVKGYPSDDTQLAFWTLEQLLADRGLVPAHVASRFTRDHIFGIGSAVRAFLVSMHGGTAWDKAGRPSAGNGALMRIAPVVIPHLQRPSADLWADTALCAMITHNDSASIAACVAFVHLIWELFRMTAPPEPLWWVREYVSVARQLESGAAYRPRGGPFHGRYAGPLWGFVEKVVPEAFAKGLSVRDACDRWYSGAFLLETVPSVLYILMRHRNGFEEAVVRAVNDTVDNDTIAAVVGAAAGALHGRRAIPKRWIDRLSGRTTDRDDGRVFQLLEAARRTWGGK
jgi:ADP-ribosyl-[dinitrogen reductase] hydrolase